ncbi:MAG TPA: FG-GAP-like repeat-containing protein [Cyclobacteriaceae bacterium]|nr:FG-GAP-like repeat-containing protein [Cyclobacteriaceae bacterium]
MRLLFTLVLLALASSTLSAQPKITSFSPVSATAGTALTITGTNFSSTAVSNSVYFGLSKATVTEASSTQLSVVVPVGAEHSYITVTTGGLTAYSPKKFIVLLPGGPNDIAPTSFSPLVVNLAEKSGGGSAATIADFDGDGKADIFATRYGVLNVYRNTTISPGQISFQKGANSPAPFPAGLATGDLNGDGKLDVASANYEFGTTYSSVWLNTTASPGSAITFNTRQDINTSPYTPSGIAIHDLNGDGKPDILLINNGDANSDLTVLTNTTVTSNVFTYTATQFAVSGGGGAIKIAVDDFDGDGKPDVAIANPKVDRVHVLRNTTTGATITFATKIDLIPSNTVFDVTTTDFNADGKAEIITVGVSTPRTLSVFRNVSSGVGNLAFASRTDFTHDTFYSESVFVHDIDGDGKPDLIGSNYVRKNTSSGSTISCEAAVSYEPTVTPGTIGNDRALANDLDGDGVAEIIGFRTYFVGADSWLAIVVQKYIPQPRITSIDPTSARLGEIVTITGNYLSNVSGVKFGSGLEIKSFTLNSSTSITTIVSDATSGNVTATGTAGSHNIAGFTLIPGPTVTSFTPESGPMGTIVTITGTNLGSTPADNRVYFGVVRATVTEASATIIKAIVPAGYSEVPVSVGVGIQTSSALRPFRVTFHGGTGAFSEKSMSSPVKVGESVKPYSPAVGDFNSDNKPDIVALGIGGIHVFFNTTANGVVSMSPSTLLTASEVKHVAVVDVDGDGKQDIVAMSGFLFNVFRNTSIPGNNSFAPGKQFLLSGSGVGVFAIGDIDGDGRPDIVSNNPSATFTRNISYQGNIDFASTTSLAGGQIGSSIAIADLDQDGKSDIVMSLTSQNLVIIHRNLSTPSTLSLATPITVSTQLSPDVVSVADLNKDNLPDIVVISKTKGTASSIINTSTTGLTFSASAPISLANMPTIGSSALGDINGDANPDIVLPNSTGFIGLMKNTSASGSDVTFETYSNATTSNDYFIDRPVLVDIDGNGELDVVGGRSTGAGSTATQYLTVLRNQINEPIIASFSPARAGTGSTLTISGENFLNVTGVSIGGSAATSFQVVSPTEIKAVIGAGASGNILVTNGHFLTEKPGFTFYNGPIITSFDPASAAVQEVVTITGLQFTGTSAVSFGDVPALSFTVVSSTTITAKVGVGASGKIKVTSSAGSDEKAGFTYIMITGTEPLISSDLYAIEIYPNPSNGKEFSFKLHDSWDDKEVPVVLTDMSGRTVVSQHVVARGLNRWISPSESLVPGMYVLSVVLNDRRTVTKLVVYK